jgi:hypothetical protein
MVLSGCGTADDASVPTNSTNAKARKRHLPVQAAKPGEEDMADMVAAASTTKTGIPVEVKFTLSQRPQVGQALDVNVAIVPGTPAPDSLAVSFQVTDGLELVNGAELLTTDKPVEGAPLRHVIRVLPKRDGIFALTAVVSTGPANQSPSRTFSIPVIAGEGMPEQVAKEP